VQVEHIPGPGARIRPVAPHRFVVARASATSRAAPRAELVEPFRNRVAAITGADVGVDTVAGSAFSPFTLL
jgi:hypothetical protein